MMSLRRQGALYTPLNAHTANLEGSRIVCANSLACSPCDSCYTKSLPSVWSAMFSARDQFPSCLPSTDVSPSTGTMLWARDLLKQFSSQGKGVTWAHHLGSCSSPFTTDRTRSSRGCHAAAGYKALAPCTHDAKLLSPARTGTNIKQRDSLLVPLDQHESQDAVHIV